MKRIVKFGIVIILAVVSIGGAAMFFFRHNTHKNRTICDSESQLSYMINTSASKPMFFNQIFVELDVNLPGNFGKTFRVSKPFSFTDVCWVDHGEEKRLLIMPYSLKDKNRYGIAVFLNQNSIPEMNILSDIIREKDTCPGMVYLESGSVRIPAFCVIDKAGMLMETLSSDWSIIIAVEKTKGIILWN